MSPDWLILVQLGQNYSKLVLSGSAQKFHFLQSLGIAQVGNSTVFKARAELRWDTQNHLEPNPSQA